MYQVLSPSLSSLCLMIVSVLLLLEGKHKKAEGNCKQKQMTHLTRHMCHRIISYYILRLKLQIECCLLQSRIFRLNQIVTYVVTSIWVYKRKSEGLTDASCCMCVCVCMCVCYLCVQLLVLVCSLHKRPIALSIECISIDRLIRWKSRRLSLSPLCFTLFKSLSLLFSPGNKERVYKLRFSQVSQQGKINCTLHQSWSLILEPVLFVQRQTASWVYVLVE